MKSKVRKIHKHLINLIFPALGFGVVSGAATGAIITVYKWCAKHVVHLSEMGFVALRAKLWLLPVVLLGLFGLSYIFVAVYKKTPDLRGGGIPTAIAVLRDLITFKWLRNLVGVFIMSLTSFLVGVPLGSEGPSVQIGVAVGRGSILLTGKKTTAWNRYSMTGGACAGFAVATGAPVSGIMFALEEAHQRISPLIIIVSATSVVFSCIVAEILSPIMGVSVALFPKLDLVEVPIYMMWLPAVIGVASGLFAVLFSRCYEGIHSVLKKLTRVPMQVKIFAVLAITAIMGLLSLEFVSTGHELTLTLFVHNSGLWMLVAILLVRMILTLAANANGLTGGMFLPLLAIGAVLAAILGNGLSLLGMDESYYQIVLVLGIVACIAGLIKAPVTAVVFAIEALGCAGNVLPVVLTAVSAYMITEIFSARSVTESVLENQVEHINVEKEHKVIDTFVRVEDGSFAVGKQIRDILWPANLFVLSVQRTKVAEVDQHGEKTMLPGDVLHVRYSTVDDERTRQDLTAIVGQQNYVETEAEII